MAARTKGRMIPVALVAVLLGSCADRPPELPLRIGINRAPSALLMIVARERGYFEAQGLKPEYREFVSGKRAVREGLRAGEIDLVSASDLPVVQSLRAGDHPVIIASLQKATSVNRIVADRSRGIASFDDLRGRRIGTQENSALHYFLDRALRFNDFPHDAVIRRFYPAEELSSALAQGEVDAVAVREPFLSEARRRLGQRALVLEAPDVYAQFELLLTSYRYARENPETLRRALRALLAAERHVRDHPRASARTLAQFLGADEETVLAGLGRQSNVVRLPQILAGAMEAQAAWIVDVGGGADSPFELLRAVDPEPLLAVRPGAVSFIEQHAGWR